MSVITDEGFMEVKQQVFLIEIIFYFFLNNWIIHIYFSVYVLQIMKQGNIISIS